MRDTFAAPEGKLMSSLTRFYALMVACLLATGSLQAVAAQQPTPQTVDYPAGWNLVSGPSTTPFLEAVGPLYSLNEDGTSYKITPAAMRLPADGDGYWAYFSQPIEKIFSSSHPEPITLSLAPGVVSMIGNPFLSPATVSGVDALIIYDPTQGYQETDTIPVGRGAFVYPSAGGEVTISESP